MAVAELAKNGAVSLLSRGSGASGSRSGSPGLMSQRQDSIGAGVSQQSESTGSQQQHGSLCGPLKHAPMACAYTAAGDARPPNE